VTSRLRRRFGAMTILRIASSRRRALEAVMYNEHRELVPLGLWLLASVVAWCFLAVAVATFIRTI
jgi:hypothetical protein